MTLRLVGDPAAPVNAAPPASGPGAGRRYLERRRASAGYPLPDAVERLSRALRSRVHAEKAEPGQGRVRAVMYHLVGRGESADYRRELARVVARAQPFAAAVSGPWPPFAFAPELLG